MEDFSSTGTASSVAEATERDRHRIAVGASVSGEPYSPTLETSGTRATGAPTAPSSARVSKRASGLSVAPRIRHRINAFFECCIKDLDLASDNSAHFFLRNNCLARVRDSLADLWSVRSKREEQFSEVINMLQCVFVGRPVEEFVDTQIDAIRCVFVRLRDEPVFDDEMANEVTADLLKGGVDVFRELA